MEIYAAVVRRLITTDHTYGDARSPFRLVYVADSTDAWRELARGERGEPLSVDVKAGILRQLSDLPLLEFLSETKVDRFTTRFRDSNPDRAVIVTLGPVDGSGDRVEVQVRMYCGGLCGQALTYVVENRNGTWRTAGMTGPYVTA